ncbi:MAG: hypothetical protein PXZ08_04345 [Actinomycetota bacterium]|nr:hypothetical protein [Actinomycetota bacterium]
MEQSQLRETPYEVGRSRLFDRMNAHAGPFTHVCRLDNPEGARMSLHVSPGVRVEAWHQSGAELAALYSWNEAWILFDRFNYSDDTDTVVVVSAPTLEGHLAAVEFVMATSAILEDWWNAAASDD